VTDVATVTTDERERALLHFPAWRPLWALEPFRKAMPSELWALVFPNWAEFERSETELYAKLGLVRDVDVPWKYVILGRASGDRGPDLFPRPSAVRDLRGVADLRAQWEAMQLALDTAATLACACPRGHVPGGCRSYLGPLRASSAP
jgi:hypothetical protein